MSHVTAPLPEIIHLVQKYWTYTFKHSFIEAQRSEHRADILPLYPIVTIYCLSASLYCMFCPNQDHSLTWLQPSR